MDKLNTLYGDLLKRLDDSSDEVRVEVTRTMIAYMEYVSVWFYIHVEHLVTVVV